MKKEFYKKRSRNQLSWRIRSTNNTRNSQLVKFSLLISPTKCFKRNETNFMTSISILDYRCCRIAKGSKWFIILTVCRLPAWACWVARWRDWRTPTGYLGSPHWVHDRPVVCPSGSATTWSSSPGRAGAAGCRLNCPNGIWSGWMATTGLAFPALAAPAPGFQSSDARAPSPTTPPSRTRVRTLVVAVSPVPESSQPGMTRATTGGYNRAFRYRVSRNYRYKSRPRISRARNRFSLSKHLVMFLSFQFSTLNSHLIIKCHVKIGTSYLVEKEQEFGNLPFYFSTLNFSTSECFVKFYLNKFLEFE